MRKYYYVCPRCGRCYKRYIPRRKTKCNFCSTVWKTRGAKGTRSAFSWTATLALILALAAAVFFVGRELGVFPKSSDVAVPAQTGENSLSLGLGLELSTESAENLDAVNAETPTATETPEATATSAATATSEDAAAE